MVDYQLERKAVRQLTIRVDEHGVHVKAPLFMSMKRIEDFINQKEAWIVKKQALFGAMKRLVISDGAPLEYMGQIYTIQIHYLERGRTKVVLDGDVAHIWSVERERDKLRLQVIAWYRKEARRVFTERLQICHQKLAALNIPNPELHIRLMKTRFGVCNPGRAKVTLNLALILHRQILLDYVIVHELLHFIYADHSKNYYDLFSQWMPNWKMYRKELQDSHYQYKSYLE
ncbi:M48 family metallopeptidase [Culicoidibacter larvae]|uniref:M48 family metallopeptidase n=1 Tax=Culicoidibacter larvae TaxID=2579976 RepID=A0A5R8QGE8_9FIRM|nr:SprT family zinc-dependent metalloprotease [Culicoidibacter larvae]TLG77085.1 M48 family metallopeptidase [Culicoidibacter larvae]